MSDFGVSAFLRNSLRKIAVFMSVCAKSSRIIVAAIALGSICSRIPMFFCAMELQILGNSTWHAEFAFSLRFPSNISVRMPKRMSAPFRRASIDMVTNVANGLGHKILENCTVSDSSGSPWALLGDLGLSCAFLGSPELS